MENGGSYGKSFDYRWSEFFEDVDSILLQMSKMEINPDIIVAVAMGGINLGVVIAKDMGLPLYTIKVKSYRGKTRGDLYIGEIPEGIRGKKVFVVDDIIDTKQTITGVCERLKDYKVDVVGKAVLIKREGVKERCIFGRSIGKGTWCNFAWEYR